MKSSYQNAKEKNAYNKNMFQKLKTYYINEIQRFTDLSQKEAEKKDGSYALAKYWEATAEAYYQITNELNRILENWKD